MNPNPSPSYSFLDNINLPLVHISDASSNPSSDHSSDTDDIFIENIFTPNSNENVTPPQSPTPDLPSSASNISPPIVDQPLSTFEQPFVALDQLHIKADFHPLEVHQIVALRRSQKDSSIHLRYIRSWSTIV